MAILILALGVALVLIGVGIVASIPWYVAFAILWIGGGILAAAGLCAMLGGVNKT
jgi:hypothetical protein